MLWHVCFDIGHTTGSGGRPPAAHAERREDDEALCYAVEAHLCLHAVASVEITSTLLTFGRYADRQKWATASGCDIYVACHTNAGGKDYGLVLGRPGNPNDRALGLALQAKMKSLPGVKRFIVDEVGPEGYRPTNPWPAPAYGLIKGLPGSTAAVVLEPGFLDGAAHAGLWTSAVPNAIGHALGTAIREYIATRGTP